MTQEGATPPGYHEQIRRMIREELARLMYSGSSRNMSVGEGGSLTIKGGRLVVRYPEADGGGIGAYFGDLYEQSTGAYAGTGLVVQNKDGTDMLVARTDEASGGAWVNLYDTGGRIIAGNDTNSGQGLARPYVPGVFYRADYDDWPAETSTAFVTKYRARMPKQHPRLYVRAWTSNDTSGATGEVRVLVNGAVWGAAQATAFAISEKVWGPAPVDGAHMDTLVVELQARMVSGAGGVRCAPSRLDGQQS